MGAHRSFKAALIALAVSLFATSGSASAQVNTPTSTPTPTRTSTVAPTFTATATATATATSAQSTATSTLTPTSTATGTASTTTATSTKTSTPAATSTVKSAAVASKNVGGLLSNTGFESALSIPQIALPVTTNTGSWASYNSNNPGGITVGQSSPPVNSGTYSGQVTTTMNAGAGYFYQDVASQLPSQGYTFSTYVYPSTGAQTVQLMYGWDHNQTYSWIAALKIDTSSSTTSFTVGGTATSTVAGPGLSAGSWHQVTIVGYTSGVNQVYFDGVSAPSISVTPSASLPTSSQTATVLLGLNGTFASPTSFYFDDVLLVGQPVPPITSPGNICCNAGFESALNASVPSGTSVISTGNWTPVLGTGSTAAQSTSYMHSGSYSLGISGTGNPAFVYEDGASNVDLTNGYKISTWFVPSGGQNAIIGFEIGYHSTPTFVSQVTYDTTTALLQLNLGLCATSTACYTSTSTTVSLVGGTWHQATLVAQSNGLHQVFLDGSSMAVLSGTQSSMAVTGQPTVFLGCCSVLGGASLNDYWYDDVMFTANLQTTTVPTSVPIGIPTGIPTVITSCCSSGGTTSPPPTGITGTGTAPTSPTGAVIITTTSSLGGTTPSGGVVVASAGTGAGVSDLPSNLTLPTVFTPPPVPPTVPGQTNLPTAPVVAPGAAIITTAPPPIDPSVFTATAPVAINASVSSQTGGVIISGNAALIVPPAAIANVPGGKATFDIKAAVNVPIPGGPTQFSPLGTQLDVRISDANGNPVTTFPVPIPIEVKYNAADIGQSNGHPETLTAAYVVDALTPGIANPLHFPNDTFVLFPSENTANNPTTGTLTIITQAIGSTISVVTNPVGYVQTFQSSTPELSSFDPGQSQTFGTKPQFSYLQVVEPQIGNRLLVLDPDTGNYSYVDAASVGASGPPPPKSSAAVVRGVRRGSPTPSPKR